MANVSTLVGEERSDQPGGPGLRNEWRLDLDRQVIRERLRAVGGDPFDDALEPVAEAHGSPVVEDQPLHPVDPYGIAKYAAELLVKNVCETHGLEYVIAVPHNIIGPKQKYDDPYRNVASIMINRMLQGKQPVIYGDGGQKRCFSFVQDCVNPLIKMGTQAGLSGEVINIGPDEEYVSILELAQIIAELTRFDLDPIFVADRPREVRDARCSADKARRLLGYETKVTLREGLQSIIDWIRAHGTKPFDYHLPIEIDSPLLPNTWRDKLM